MATSASTLTGGGTTNDIYSYKVHMSSKRIPSHEIEQFVDVAIRKRIRLTELTSDITTAITNGRQPQSLQPADMMKNSTSISGFENPFKTTLFSSFVL